MGTLSATIALAISGAFKQALAGRTAVDPIQYGPNFVFTNGSGANQANAFFLATRTLAASANEDLDLSGGLTDAFGNALALTKLKGLVVVADPGNTNDVVVGGATSNGAVSMFGDPTDKVKVKPGGMMALVAPNANGYAITDATADLLRIANGGSGTGVTYTIVLIGA